MKANVCNGQLLKVPDVENAAVNRRPLSGAKRKWAVTTLALAEVVKSTSSAMVAELKTQNIVCLSL